MLDRSVYWVLEPIEECANGESPERLSSRASTRLDERFHGFGPVTRFTLPSRGWINGIRGALGMTTAQLAKRVQVKQPSIVDIENSEARGTIELATLRRVAEALNCTVV